VAESLYRKAIGKARESVTAAIFWLRTTRARWQEVSVYEHVEAQEKITISQTEEFIRRALERAEQFTEKVVEMAARNEQADVDRR
jgi:hypothetical protein